jgi:hypothetical protein
VAPDALDPKCGDRLEEGAAVGQRTPPATENGAAKLSQNDLDFGLLPHS